ncbi:Putative glutathione S-transferase, Thioredoxin-like superfamily, glutathione Transferase family [Septoria linicola]|uniref:Glutathione S-transferase, Thioredoxin-like superfamily, glutathione Transferase family n=1 Tax=Septoria linicola TaxID=215465 RepID=A0A9Q9AJR0_9PEZI|nr:Putative glutathione S-transferase, Thioredoxin-like superfamily, glutathione Transferase family [Septoria linicola]
MAEQQPAKKQRTQPTYELLYHPGIPGRGEFIRLAFEAKGVPYYDIANEDQQNGYAEVQKICIGQTAGVDGNPPVFSPPALRVQGAGKDGQSLIISQTPNILWYLGDKLGLTGTNEAEKYYVQQLALTALDLNNEVHDTHHPIAVAKYYEDQKEESLKKAQDVRENRIPKFLSYFARTLEWNAASGKNKYLVGGSLTYADLTVWQVLDGLQFAFPKELEARKKEFPELLGTFYDGVKADLKEYLDSSRRLQYSQGVYRYYPELDRQLRLDAEL